MLTLLTRAPPPPSSRHRPVTPSLCAGLATQLLREVEWGDIDLLLIDMGPGVSEVHRCAAETLELEAGDGALLLTDGSTIGDTCALLDASLCDSLGVAVLGTVTNGRRAGDAVTSGTAEEAERAAATAAAAAAAALREAAAQLGVVPFCAALRRESVAVALSIDQGVRDALGQVLSALLLPTAAVTAATRRPLSSSSQREDGGSGSGTAALVAAPPAPSPVAAVSM